MTGYLYTLDLERLVIFSFQGKDPKIDLKVSRGIRQPRHDSKECLLPDRKIVVHGRSNNPSSTQTSFSTAVLHKGSITENALRVNDNSITGGDARIKMVDRKFGSHERETYAPTSSRDGHLLGCSQDGRLGSGVSSRINGGSVVRIGKGITHKHPGVAGCRTGLKNFHKGLQTIFHSPENRQHLSPVIHSQHGGNPESDHVDNQKKNLGIHFATSDHDYCRMDSIPSQLDSRLGVQECVRLSRMEALSQNFPINLSADGPTGGRPICIENFTSTQSLLQLESRPRLSGSGCFSSGLDSKVPLCVSSILPDHKSSETGRGSRSEETDSHNSALAISTMVPSSHVHVSSSPSTAANVPKSLGEPIQFHSPVVERLLSKAGGLASIRDTLEQAGVPGEASSLIINSRRAGTAQTYESAWKRWSMWCSGRGVDPIRCSINPIMEYLAHLFNLGTPSRTIGCHRSAISAYHHPITVNSALVTVGRHPLVSALMSGINNLRPPKQRYSFTWDVELVLGLFKAWPLDLSPK